MEIDVYEFIERSEHRFSELKHKWIDTIDLEEYNDSSRYTVKYGKDISITSSDKPMFSASILRHIDLNKSLFSRLYKNLPKKSNPGVYTSYFYNDEGHLIMSEFVIDVYSKQRTYFLCTDNENVQITYFIFQNKNGQSHKSFYSVEYALYDADKKLLACETYVNLFKPPYGISASGEYYKYDDTNGRLIAAVKFEDYNKNFINSDVDRICKQAVPDLVINPHEYNYLFEYNQGQVFCNKIKRYTYSQDKIYQYELNAEELTKLSNNGVICFGV